MLFYYFHLNNENQDPTTIVMFYMFITSQPSMFDIDLKALMLPILCAVYFSDSGASQTS